MKRRKQVPRQVRQGDVLIEETTRTVPDGAVPRPKEIGRVVLAHGEVTGHAHCMADPTVSALYDVEDVTLLTVDVLSTVVHDEHGAVTLLPGVHEVVRQSEYAPEEIRQVAD